MADEWFYVRDGEKVGPISSADLKKLAISGQLQLADLIWKQGMKQWVPASSAKGLFPESPPIPTAPTPPPQEPVVAPVVVTAVRKPPKAGTAKASFGASVIYLCALGAIICLVASRMDFTPRVMNVVLSLCNVLLYSTLPVAIICRLKEDTRPLGITRTALLYICVACIAVSLTLLVANGFLIRNFHWPQFLRVACNVALTVFFLSRPPRGVEVIAMPALALLLAVINGLDTLSGVTATISNFAAGNRLSDPLRLSRLLIYEVHLVLIGVAALWYTIWRASTPAPVPSSPALQQSDVSAATGAATSAAQRFAAAVRGRAADAARLAQATAERTTLLKVTLPRAYAELGKFVYRDPSRQKDATTNSQAIAALLAERQQIEAEGKARPQATSLADKAKKAAADAAMIARLKALDLKLFQQFAGLGEAAYAAAGADAGPAECIQAIAKALLRRDELDADMKAIEDASKGQVVTPKRLVWGTAICLVVGLLIAVGSRGQRGDDRGGESVGFGEAGGADTAVASGSPTREPKSAGTSALYKNGYAYGLELANTYKRGLARSGVPSRRQEVLDEIETVKQHLLREIQTPGQAHLIDFNRGKLDGLNAGLKDPTWRD